MKKVLTPVLTTLIVLFITAFSSLAVETTFYVYNTVNDSLGTVTIYYTGGSTQVNVSGQGSYPVTVPSSVTGVVINSQGVVNPNIGPVTLQSGKSVDLQWGTSAIEVIDPNSNG